MKRPRTHMLSDTMSNVHQIEPGDLVFFPHRNITVKVAKIKLYTMNSNGEYHTIIQDDGEQWYCPSDVEVMIVPDKFGVMA